MRICFLAKQAALAVAMALFLLPALVIGAECSNAYDSDSGQLRLSCIPTQAGGGATGLVGGNLVYRGQNLFELTNAWTYEVKSAQVADVRIAIATGSIPVVMVTAYLSSGCYYLTPLIDTVISGLEVRLDVRVFLENWVPGEVLEMCSLGHRTVVFPVALNRELRSGTYTVTANGVTRTFDYTAPGYPPE